MRPSLLLHFLLAFFFINISDAHAQYEPGKWKPEMLPYSTQENGIIEKGQNVIWHESFSGGLTEGWLTEGASGFCGFQHTYSGPQGPFSIGLPPLNSQTAHDGFMILDTDLCTSQDGSGLLSNAWMQSPPIAIDDEGSMMLAFQHSFRYCCSATETEIVVEVSTDGESWHTYDVRNNVMPNAVSANPVYQAIDISEIIQGSSQVWIRFRKTHASHYYWMIDDVMLFSFTENDLEVFDSATLPGFLQIPDGQFEPMQLGAKVRNIGGQPQNNMRFTLSVNDYLVRETFHLPEIGPSQVADFKAPELFDPPGRGIYHIKYQAEQDQTDSNPENNLVEWQVEITDTTFSRTAYTQQTDDYFWQDEGYTAGTFFPIYQESQLTSVSFIPHDISEEGASFMGKLFFVNPDQTLTEIAATEWRTFSWSSDDDDDGDDDNGGDDGDDDNGGDDGDDDNGGDDGDDDNGGDDGDDDNGGDDGDDDNGGDDGDDDNGGDDGDDDNGGDEGDDDNGGDDGDDDNGGDDGDDDNGGDDGDDDNGGDDGDDDNGGDDGDDDNGGDDGDDDNGGDDGDDDNGGDDGGDDNGGDDGDDVNGGDDGDDDNGGDDGDDDNGHDDGDTDDAGNPDEGEKNGSGYKNDDTPHFVLSFEEAVVLQPGMYVAAIVVPEQEQKLAISITEPVSDLEAASLIITPGGTEMLEGLLFLDMHLGNNTSECQPMVHFSISNSLCATSTGSIEAVPLNGVSPYSYQWEGFEETDGPLLEALLPGDYSVTIVDARGCESTHTVNLEDEPISVEHEIVTAMCDMAGFITLSPQNGSEPFTYDWSHDPALNSPLASNLASGDYTVTIVDANQCATELTLTVPNVDVLPVEVTRQHAYCGSQSGQIILEPLSGVEPFTFVWDDIPGHTSNIADNLTAGTYHYTVTDANGCSFSGSQTIANSAYQVSSAANITHASCGLSNGSIAIVPVNGHAPFLYEWATGETTETITDLSPGTYHIELTDQFGCTGTKTVMVENIGNMPQVTWLSEQTSACGNSDGSFTIEPESASASYSYVFLNNPADQPDNGDDTEGSSTNKNNSFVVDNLPAGQYLISVTNDDGCEMIVAANVSDEGAPQITGVVDDVRCNGEANGSITVSLDGASDPLYQWDNAQQSTTPSVESLSAGWYTLHVTEGDCIAVESFQVIEPEPIHAQADVNHIVCANDQLGAILLSVSGGVMPYSYIWNTGQSGRDLENVTAGDYTVTITDFHDCVLQQSFTIEGYDLLTVSGEVTDASDGIANGSIVLSVSGGAGNYAISWEHGPQSSMVSGLAPGSYTVTVTDGVGCLVTETFTLLSVGIETYSPSEVVIFPNPATDKITLLWDSTTMKTDQKVHVEIFNIVGNKVIDAHMDFERTRPKAVVKLDDMPPGVYIFRATVNKETFQTRFVKH